MIKHLTVPLAFLLTIGSQVSASNQDTATPSRPINYVCNWEAYIIISTEAGWVSLSHPHVTVTTTYDGFLLADHETGIERSIGKLASGAVVMYVYQENDIKRYGCVLIGD
jgi:hypothetical protein